jgi:hypothetical protein
LTLLEQRAPGRHLSFLCSQPRAYSSIYLPLCPSTPQIEINRSPSFLTVAIPKSRRRKTLSPNPAAAAAATGE